MKLGDFFFFMSVLIYLNIIFKKYSKDLVTVLLALTSDNFRCIVIHDDVNYI